MIPITKIWFKKVTKLLCLLQPLELNQAQDTQDMIFVYHVIKSSHKYVMCPDWFCRQQMLMVFLPLRVMDLPILKRRPVSESSSMTKPSSTASACFSNSQLLNCGRRLSSDRSPIAAAAVQVRSHDGCGLYVKDQMLRECTFMAERDWTRNMSTIEV